MQMKAKAFNFFNTKVGNDFRHDSYACFFQNVVKYSFAGGTNFSSVFMYSGSLFSLPLIETVQMKAKDFNFFNTKIGNSVHHDSYTTLLQNIVKFSFAGRTNFSSILRIATRGLVFPL